MYFKKLEMLGFKSFADKTILNFEPGITAVVGPNGCGKSNIFDAIRWVLGEQSVKSLRGSSMEDVIFNGTDKKAGVGFAEVSLTFSNENNALPIEYDEVTVTRRLFRSGESEYLLNKTQVRLKDILELFMGTGIGAESYSLIEQGKVDLLISSRPEDRRLIFDEASGITKYKSKKREALNKLQDTENNLLRINDIITEVKRQIGSIERQANKARRYKEEFEKLKDFETKLAFFELDKLKAQGQDLSRQSLELKTKEAAFNTEVEGLNQKLLSYNFNLEKLKDELEEVKARDLKFESSIEMDRHEIELNKERIADAKNRCQRLDEGKLEINQRMAGQNERIEKLKIEINGLGDLGKNISQLLQEKNTLLAEIALVIKEAQDAIARSKKSILEKTSQNSKLKNEIIEVSTQVQQFLARKRRLEIEKTKVTAEKTDSQANLEGVAKGLNEIQERLKNLNLHKDESAGSLETLKSQLKVIAEKIITLEKEKVTLESQEEFVEDLKLQYQEMPSPVKGILLIPESPAGNITGILGRVKEVLPVEDKYKQLAEGINQNTAMIKQLVCETKFIELDSQKIAQRIQEVISSIERLKAEESSLNTEIEARNKQVEDLQSQVHQEEINLSNQEMQKNNVLEQLAKLEAELELIADELNETTGSLDKISAREGDLKNEHNGLEEQLRQAQNLINESQDLVSLKSKEKEAASVAMASAETELASLAGKEKSLMDSLKVFEGTKSREEEELLRLEKEKEELSLKAQDLERQNVSLEKKIEDAGFQEQLLKDRFQETQARIADCEGLIKNEELKKGSVVGQAQNILSRFHELQMLEQEISFKEQGTKERFLQSYKINLEEVKDISLEGIDIELLNSQVAELRKKLDAFGTVNLVAIEEYEELKKRFEFLNLQQADLLSAKEQLHSTITKINRTTKQLFLDTFSKVAEEFKVYFKLLFGGGEAQLILIDPEDVLETGIEIVARPPGKKLQSISLLSGGEKALTAIALIFGVFKVRPSPFCILDEIDAALDESNVNRFGQLLKEFVKASQFIVITHNKKTIVNAGLMYGITMQETGVSKIVSVKFAEKDEAKNSGVRESKEVAVAAS